MPPLHFDYLIIGSGFGGSVSAYRLAQKGYRVAVIEQGRRFSAKDFPTKNTQIRRAFWLPSLGCYGPTRMSFFRHVTILSGVGVGGGSLVYANTLPTPKLAFFSQGSWASLADWQTELAPFYATALQMLGATTVPFQSNTDDLLRSVADDRGQSDNFAPTRVAVYFGEADQTVADPYFDGRGPDRTGCNRCGGCMLGCRHNAKNTLDKNYLYLAEGLGVTVFPQTRAVSIKPTDGGFEVQCAAERVPKGPIFTAQKVIVAAGVLGTVELLLRMKKTHLPRLSPLLGRRIRTNSEALIGVMNPDPTTDFSKGIAIGSILHTDAHSHVEPVRYPEGGANLYRLLVGPHAPGPTFFRRCVAAIRWFLKNPGGVIKTLLAPDFAKRVCILLYMQSLEGTLTFRLRPWGMGSELPDGAAPPRAYIAEATEIAEQFAQKFNGVVIGLMPEFLFGTPTTAHILGGATMGRDAESGVIDADHHVHNYPGLYVIDGSAISSNVGVNPALTITALAERAMSLIPEKDAL